MGISDVSHVFRRLFRNDLCTKNAGSPEMLKTNKGHELEHSHKYGLRHHNSLESGDILTSIQTCIPKRMERRFFQIQEISSSFLSWLPFMKVAKI